jgi:thioredoxin reductase
MAKSGILDGKQPRIAILGAGPVGVEAALYASHLKLPFRVYERGRIGEHLQQWKHIRLFSPFGMNSTPLGKATLKEEQPRLELPGEADLLTAKEHLDAYLEPLACSPALLDHITTETAVLRIGRRGYLKHEGFGDPRRGQQPFVLLLRNASGQERIEEADVVLDCTGTYGNPRHLGVGGVPAVGELAVRGQIAWGLEDVLGARREHYADRTTLVVGGGHSAATMACQLARLAQDHPATWIIWLARRAGTQPLKRVVNDPLRERDQLCARANMLATRGEGHVEFYSQAIVDKIEKPAKEVDRIIANVGGEPDNQLYRELQVAECPATRAPAGMAQALLKQPGDGLKMGAFGGESLRTAEPGFFILGGKSFGRTANFLMRIGFEQVRDVFALITGKAGLDLYKKGR